MTGSSEDLLRELQGLYDHDDAQYWAFTRSRSWKTPPPGLAPGDPEKCRRRNALELELRFRAVVHYKGRRLDNRVLTGNNDSTHRRQEQA